MRLFRPITVAAVLVVLVHIAACGWGAWTHSPTANEPAYLSAGISHWEFGRFDLCRVSPPLVRLVAAVPVRLAQPALDWSHYRQGPGERSENAVGRDFCAANGKRTFWLFTLGRWACIPFSLIGAWVSYHWANQLFGRVSAFVALVLWCFSPNILAHAQMLTPDIGVTALCLAACYAFWKFSRSPGWWNAIAAGALLGLATLAKTNAIVLYPALAISLFIHGIARPEKFGAKALVRALAAYVVSIYIINLGFGFEGSFRKLGDYTFFSQTFRDKGESNRFRGTFLEKIPVPLPASFIEGIDLQRRDFENEGGSKKSYLRGKWYDHGWWWYYFYVIAVKVPVGTWLLALVGGGSILFGRAGHRLESLCYLMIPGAALFALGCSQTGFGHSLRYVLPAFPFAFVVGSAAVHARAGLWQRRLSTVAATWVVFSSLSIFPHSLAYFNEVAGGPLNGHFHLLDGNVDWGQDLLYVLDWIDDHPEATPVYAAYWGTLPLHQMGIDFTLPEMKDDAPPPPGWYALSVNHLRREFRFGNPKLVRFLNEPVADRVTYTMSVYRVE